MFVSDVGRTIDRARVLSEALERDTVPPEASLVRDELDALIFRPGFSKVQALLDPSRGSVGTSFVRRNTTQIGG